MTLLNLLESLGKPFLPSFLPYLASLATITPKECDTLTVFGTKRFLEGFSRLSSRVTAREIYQCRLMASPRRREPDDDGDDDEKEQGSTVVCKEVGEAKRET